MPNCPVCSSDEVYILLNTLHCKRCKNIWKEGGGPDQPASFGFEDTSLKIRKRTEPLETRMKKKLNEYLTRSGGKFCLTTMTWQSGDISQEMFKAYLKRCVKDHTLTETKDQYGRIWHSR